MEDYSWCQPGSIVVAVASFAWCITEGKQYTVIEFIPEYREPHFTWPEYITVADDFGEVRTFYPHRFRKP